MNRKRWFWVYIFGQALMVFLTIGGAPTSLQQWDTWFRPLRLMVESLTTFQLVTGVLFVLMVAASIWHLRFDWKGLPWGRQAEESAPRSSPVVRPTLQFESTGLTSVRRTLDSDHWITKQSLVDWLLQSDTVKQRIASQGGATRGQTETQEEQEKASAYRIIWEFEQAYAQGVKDGAYNRALFHGWLEREAKR